MAPIVQTVNLFKLFSEINTCEARSLWAKPLPRYYLKKFFHVYTITRKTNVYSVFTVFVGKKKFCVTLNAIIAFRVQINN